MNHSTTERTKGKSYADEDGEPEVSRAEKDPNLVSEVRRIELRVYRNPDRTCDSGSNDNNPGDHSPTGDYQINKRFMTLIGWGTYYRSLIPTNTLAHIMAANAILSKELRFATAWIDQTSAYVVPKSASESIPRPSDETGTPTVQTTYGTKKTMTDWYNPSSMYIQNFLLVYSSPRIPR